MDIQQPPEPTPERTGLPQAQPRPGWDLRGEQRARAAEGEAGPVFVLVHSPLLGPTSWALVGQELSRRGHQAIVPSLLGIPNAPDPKWRYATAAVRAATARVAAPMILIGHAAAGPLLPAIAAAIRGKVGGIIFVDAPLPPESGSTSLGSARFMEQLRAVADSGLAPRSSWFRQQVAEGVIPAESAAAALVDEIPAIPLSYFGDHVTVPAGWSARPCGYLLLSRDAHAEDAIKARAKGWPVAAPCRAHHLSVVTSPLTIADALLDLVGNLDPAGPLNERSRSASAERFGAVGRSRLPRGRRITARREVQVVG
jgi:hypothetical protein